jgi:MFS family permease
MGVRAEEYKRGWPALLASAIGSGVGVAPLAAYSLGAFVEPLTEEFGWGRGDVTAAALFKSIAVLLAGAVVGGLADRFGARPVALISQVLLALAFAAMSLLTDQIWTLYIGYFLFAILGAGTLPMIWGRAIVGWFSASRGVALGLSLVGTGITGMLLPSYVSWLSDTVGWRGAFIGLGALPLLLGLPAALLFFREPPGDTVSTAGVKTRSAAAAAGHSFSAAMKTVTFWQMSASFVIVSLAISGLLVHALPLLTDRGIERPVAAALAGLFGLAVTFGRLISGAFLDMFPGPIVAAVMFLVPALALGVLIGAGDNLILCGGAILCVGLAAGAESDVAAYLVAQYFGRANYAAIYGMLYTLFGLGAGAGPFVVGKVFDRYDSYQPALIGGIVLFVIAALLIGLVRPPRAHAEEAAPVAPPLPA